jgi:DNA modification methylase
VIHDRDVQLYHAAALDHLVHAPNGSVDAIVTSPPYMDAREDVPHVPTGQWPLLFHVLLGVSRGPMALNVGRLWRDRRERLWWVELVELAEAEGWVLRDHLVWWKPNANPIQGEVVTNAHELVLLFGHADRLPADEFHPDHVRTEYDPESLARMRRRFYADRGVKETVRTPGRPDRVGTVNELGARPASVVSFPVGKDKSNPHPTPMPLGLAEHLVLLTTLERETVLDPFAGSGTTLLAARRLERRAIGVELDAGYCHDAARRLAQQSLFAEAAS